MEQHFKTTIVKFGSRSGIAIPFNPDDAWGIKVKHYITGSVNGRGVRGALEAEGAQVFLPLGPVWMRDSGLGLGDDVDVILVPEGPQAGQLSPDIASALNAEPQAREFFESLATFYRKNYIKWIEGARQPKTRTARIEQMIELLKAGKNQK